MLNVLKYTVEQGYGNGYVNAYYGANTEVSSAVAKFLFALIPILLIVVIAYLVGLYKLAKAMEHPHPWWVVVPFLNIALLFQLADMSPWLVLLFFVPYVNFVAMIVEYVAMYKITQKAGADPVVGLLLAIFLPFYWPFYVLKALNKK